jgi:leucyl/phenylalanyl-tRNA--protein transferase
MVPWLRADSQALPPTTQALGAESPAPGLLAAGGTLAVARLREAYAHGVFPWYSEGQPVLWWAPDPRMVLFCAEFRLSRSLRRTIASFARSPGCEIRIDSAFERVIEACATTRREGQGGTWIVPGMVRAYTRWHRAGSVHSVETWIDGALAGGLYGVNLGRMFFGESMFAHRTDASKIALAALVCFCRENAIALIDCQQRTAHLASFGAREIPRGDFEALIAPRLGEAAPARWFYDRPLWRHLLTGWTPGAATDQEPAP